MANGFAITISAVDNASGVLAKVNKGIAQLTAPAKNFARQVDKFTELTGLKKASQGFSRLAHAGVDTAKSLARVAEPLAAITGAASIAGIIQLTDRWAAFGTSLEFASQRMGVSASYLSDLRAQGTLAGASADAMQNGFESLGQTLYDVANGQAPQASYVLSRLGISLLDAKNHARKAADVFPQLRDAISRIHNPIAQARLATILFGAAATDMLPVLRMTSGEYAVQQQLIRRYGGVTKEGAAAALQFHKAQGAVSQAVLGLTDAIEMRVAPAISGLLRQFADWLSSGRNSKFVTQDLGEAVKDFGAWIKTIHLHDVIEDIKGFGASIKSAVDYVGGWKNALIGLMAINIAGWVGPAFLAISALARALTSIPGLELAALAVANRLIGPVGIKGDVREQHTPFGQLMYDYNPVLRYADNWLYGQGDARAPEPTTEVQNSRIAQVMGAFQGAGYTTAQSAGPAANMFAESTMNPLAMNKASGAYGLGQWLGPRQADFAKQFGHTMQSVTDPDQAFKEQLQFYLSELTTGKEQDAGRRLRTAISGYQAGSIISQYDERPADPDGSLADHRGSIGQRLFDDASLAPNAKLDFGAGGRGAPGATGSVDITIRHNSPDAGLIVRTKGNVNPPRISTAMPSAGPASPYPKEF